MDAASSLANTSTSDSDPDRNIVLKIIQFALRERHNQRERQKENE